MTAILLILALAFSIASLCTNWSTARTLRRVDEDLTTLERAVFGIEGDLAAIRGELR